MKGETLLHYRIEERIGEGGMGVVYRATDTKLGRQVALKFLPAFVAHNPDEKARFLREAQTASKLDHPNIATIFEVNEIDDKVFYAMSLVEGVTLKDLRRQGPVTQKQVLQIAIQVADGLAHAHEREVVHRDIKPQNIMVTVQGQVKILDFGLAKLGLQQSTRGTTSTAGTAAYLSPEQAQGEAATPRSDLFSLGVVLYELVTGEIPFKGDHPAAVLYSVVHEDPPPLERLAPDTPPALAAVIENLLTKDPARRTASATELAAQLRSIARDLEFSGFSGRVPTVRRSSRMGWKTVAAALVAVLVLGVGSAYFLDSGGGPVVAGDQYDVAVLYFDDMTGPDDQRTGEMVTELLITDLSRQPSLRVLSSQRLYDILKQLDREGQKRIDRTVASDIARRARARQMITGSISRSGDRTRLTANIIDVATGELVRGEQVDGTDLFSMVDSLSGQVKQSLDVPVSLAQNRPVTEATTRNAEAYLQYVMGLEAYHRLDWGPAKAHFDSAIALDSNFGLAYLRAGIAAFSSNRASQGYQYLRKGEAALASGQIPPRESLFVAAFSNLVRNDVSKAISYFGTIQERYPDDKEAYFWQGTLLRQAGDAHTGIEKLKKSLELDPTYPFALLTLVNAYIDQADYPNAVAIGERYRNIRPNEPVPRIILADLYERTNRFAEARAELAEASRIDSASIYTAGELANYYARTGHLDSIRITLAPFMADTAAASNMGQANNLWGSALFLFGEFNACFEQFHRAAALEKRYGDSLAVAGHWVQLATRYYAVGELDSAEAVFRRAYVISPDNMKFNALSWRIAVARHDLREAKIRRDRFLDALKNMLDDDKIQTQRLALDGEFALMEGQYDKTLDALKAARERSGDPDDYSVWIGRALLETGHAEQARGELQQSLERYEPFNGYGYWIESWYYLGRAHEALGERREALDAYRRFLSYWGKADRPLKFIDDARARSSQLKSVSAGPDPGEPTGG
jgi:serine/threonine protein kinase/tetratricopeptide (TPR) repeat protein